MITKSRGRRKNWERTGREFGEIGARNDREVGENRATIRPELGEKWPRNVREPSNDRARTEQELGSNLARNERDLGQNWVRMRQGLGKNCVCYLARTGGAKGENNRELSENCVKTE